MPRGGGGCYLCCKGQENDIVNILLAIVPEILQNGIVNGLKKGRYLLGACGSDLDPKGTVGLTR